jgi:16S rRNA (guanine527-N7)-methyltransferase
MTAIQDFLELAGIQDAPDKAVKLEAYVDLLLQFNTSMNLIGPMSRELIIAELILDSLVPAFVWPAGKTAVDVGSGAGLPGIPLAVAFPDVQFCLVEPRKKRAQFLKIAAHRLELKNVEVFEKRIEDLPIRSFDIATSKAVFLPVEFLDVMGAWVGSGGALISMCAADAEPELEEFALKMALKKRAEIPDSSEKTQKKSDIQRAVYVWGKP